MKINLRSLPLLLLAGLTAPVWAQKRIIETAPGQFLPGTTNGLTSNVPTVVRSPGWLEKIYRPAESGLSLGGSAPPVLSAPPSEPALDPATRQRLLEERDRKKNWVLETAARLNRGESNPTRTREEGRPTLQTDSSRAANRADLMLQAVDPEYARSVRLNNSIGSTKPMNAAEAAIESAHQKAERQRRGEDPNDSAETKATREAAEAAALAGRADDFSVNNREEQDRLGLAPRIAGGGFGNARSDSSSAGRDETADRPNELFTGNSRLDGANGAAELLRQERAQEFNTLLGGAVESGTPTALAEREFSPAFSKADRALDFKRMLNSEEASPSRGQALNANASATPTAAGNSAAGLGDKPFGPTGAALGAREITSFGSNPNGNLVPAVAAPTFKAPAPLTARPAQLPIPVRGQF